jgi:hypothetical protein
MFSQCILGHFLSKRMRIFVWPVLIFCSFPLAPATCQTLSGQQHDLQAWYAGSASASPVTVLQTLALPMPVVSAASEDWIDAQGTALRIADTVPVPTVNYEASGRTTYSVYELILNLHADGPENLTPAERSKLKDAEDLLLKHNCWLLRLHSRNSAAREPSNTFLAYQRHAAAYARALVALRNASGEVNIGSAKKKADAELKDWKILGKKDKVELALTSFETLQEKSPSAFWAAATLRYRQSFGRAGRNDVPPTAIFPVPQAWPTANWTHWQSGNSSGDVTFVDIVRPWMDIAILTTHPWAWAAGVDEPSVSDGLGIGTGNPSSELMPLFPVKLVLARMPGGAGFASSISIVGVISRILPRLPNR